jgi:muramoyltetrapeptide carboxypeptidase
VLGSCLDGERIVSAPARERAAELTAMLTDPDIHVVIPPWGGELAVEVLPHLDLDAISSSPTWLVGFSDISTLLLAITTTTGVATLHGQNLMDTPYRVPEPLLPWLDVVAQPPGATVTQGPATHHRSGGFDRWQDDPTFTEYTLDAPGTWTLLDARAGELRVEGRLIGGCIETVSVLAATAYGDLRVFAASHAPEGLIVYVEASEDHALNIARDLWRMRLAGWFEHANAVLIGRTRAADDPGFTQRDAVVSAVGDLDIPIVLDVDCGHIPPHLALINGALTELTITRDTCRIVQHLR